MKRPYKARSISYLLRQQESKTTGDAQPQQSQTLGAGEQVASEVIICPIHGELEDDEVLRVPRSDIALCLICCAVALQRAGVQRCSVKHK